MQDSLFVRLSLGNSGAFKLPRSEASCISYNHCHMDVHSITPARVLKTIRDGSSVDHRALDEALAGCEGDRYLIRKMVGELQEAGLVKFEGGRFTVTDEWMKLQGLLGISLTTLIETARAASSLTVNPVFGMPSKLPIPDVFVVMSFAPDLKPIYEEHIRKVVGQLQLTVARADDFFTAHAVIEDIWTAVYRSRLIIADCTGRNANVFYEIGMAHTVGKPVILTTQNQADVPFDLRSVRYIHYAYTPPGMRIFEDHLARTISGLIKGTE